MSRAWFVRANGTYCSHSMMHGMADGVDGRRIVEAVATFCFSAFYVHNSILNSEFQPEYEYCCRHHSSLKAFAVPN